MLWLDFAAILALGWSVLAPGVEWRLEAWQTPFDGRILAGLALAVLDVVYTRGEAQRIAWLHQMLAAGACFYALSTRLRRQPNGPLPLWLPFGIGAAALGALSIAISLRGLWALRVFADAADAAWAADFGLAKALVVCTLVSAGCAVDPRSSPWWRVTTLLGAAGCVLHGLAGGILLDTRALIRLDEPLYFSTMVVTMLLLLPLTRSAWLLRRERPDESARWAGLATGFAAIAFMSLFGETRGGEGVRVLAVIGGVAVVVGHDAPKPLAAVLPGAPAMEQAAPPTARAA